MTAELDSGAGESSPDGPLPPPRRRAWARVTARGRQLQQRAQHRIDALRERSALVDTAGLVVERDREAAGTVLGSAIAFRLFLFFPPLLLVVVGVAGFLRGWLDAGEVTSQLSVSGVLADQIDAALTQPSSTRWLAVLTGLVGVAWSGRSLARALAASSSLAWGAGGNAQVRARVMGAVVGVVIGLALVSAVVNRIRDAAGVAVAGLSLGGALVIYLVLMSLLMLSLPRGTSDPGAALPGTILLSAVLAGMQAVSQLYLPGQFEDASSLYGGIGVAIVTLGWFFILGRTMSFAFSVNAMVFHRLGSLSGLLFAVPVLRELPRRSSAFRDYFDLDERGRSVRPADD